jgi:hypothetical protein
MTSDNKAAISLTTGLEDAEKVTVAFLVAVGAAESGRPTMMFLTKEADLMDRFAKAGGRYLICPICIKSKQLDDTNFITGAEPGGTVQLWEWIGDGATTFSY